MAYASRYTTIIFLCVLIFLCATFAEAQNKIQLYNNFENANGKLVYQDYLTNTLAIRPELKNADRQAVWFNAKIYNFRKDTVITINLPFDNAYYAPDPLLVLDNGVWQRIAAKNYGFYKQYVVASTADTIQIAAGIPYTYSQLWTYLKTIQHKSFIALSTLTYSEKGRLVPIVKIHQAKSKAIVKGSLLFTARQHAFEAPCSYFMEGLLRFLCSETEEAIYLRENYEIYAIPMFDVDNVADGGTGKDQLPVDFNRDWAHTPHWNAVKKTQDFLNELNLKSPIRFFMDMHSPYPISARSSHFYVDYVEGSEKYKKLKDFFDSYSKKEGFKLQMVRNDRVTTGQRTIRAYVDNDDCVLQNTPCHPSIVIATTYEQSWQRKLNEGDVYTTEQIQKSAQNMGINIAEFLKKEIK